MEVTRILHIVGRMNTGGQETNIMNIYRNIDRKKIQFNFIVHTKEKMYYEEEIVSLGGLIHRVTPKQSSIIRNFCEIRKIIKTNGYKIVVRHTSEATVFLDLLASMLGGAKIRICHSHSNNSKHIFRHKVCMLPNNLLSNYKFACSKSAGIWMFGKHRQFRIIKNTFDLNRYKYSEKNKEEVLKELGINKKDFIIGHVGRFSEEKNHRFILQIFKEVYKKNKNSKLILVGTGELMDEIKQEVVNCDLYNSVIFLGNRTDVYRLMNSFDVFLFPSLYEGFGNVLIEAQATGLRIVTTDEIPMEAEITQLFERVSLNKSADFWAEIVLKHSVVENREIYNKIVMEAGYGIDAVNDFEEFYLRK